MTVDSSGQNPFIEYRSLLDVYSRAIDFGVSDADYCRIVTDLDQSVQSVAGVGFRVTPSLSLDGTEVHEDAPREIVAKVETANVGGSHKARHLFGLLLHQRLLGSEPDGPWAIASCGNAALAAAVVARAVDHQLDVFVPADADPIVLDRLEALGAHAIICRRRPDEAGDPCMTALADALAAGSVPFTVQGPTCPDVYDGARTLGAELADQCRGLDVTDLYIQIGGGAFAVATVDGWQRHTGGTAPRLHPVQPDNAHPYMAAWLRLVPVFLDHAGLEIDTVQRSRLLSGVGFPQLGAALSAAAIRGEFDRLVDRSDAMQPWPTTPTSVATGILDDITYDWRPLMSHQLRTGGWPVTVSEEQLRTATSWVATKMLERSVTPPADATGAAGLAGALFDPAFVADPLDFSPNSSGRASRGTVAVVLSGADRSWTDEGET